MDIDYSVIIRTTGKAKEKYAGLLESIRRLEPQPREVIVVLPEECTLPEEQLGWETFYFCPRGMVIQRMTGISKCKTAYALVCDDDIQFEADFVQKLHKPLAEGLGKIAVGPLYSFLPRPGKNAMVSAVLGGAVPMMRKKRYVSVLRTAGYAYNRHLNSAKDSYYETQSAAWTCFYTEIEALRSIDFETEQQWLDLNGYSALDDQTMFYKAWLRGMKTIVVADARYEHLDARTSRQVQKPVIFSGNFNRIVFWHRFIFSQERTVFGKFWACLCIGYRLLLAALYNIVKKVPKEARDIGKEGYRAGWRYIKSDAYKSLPPVR